MSEIFRPPGLDERLVQDPELMRLHAMLERAFGAVRLVDIEPLAADPAEPAAPEPEPSVPIKMVAILRVRANIEIGLEERALDDKVDPVALLRSAALL